MKLHPCSTGPHVDPAGSGGDIMPKWNDWADEILPACKGMLPVTKRSMIANAVRGKHPDVIEALRRLSQAEADAMRAWERCSAIQSILTAERAERMAEFKARMTKEMEQHDPAQT
jgi:hypothetical protein